LEVKKLKRHFNVGKQSEVRAVDDITFDIYKGETFGLVGESGCGKSTTGRTIIRLHDATDGEVLYKGESVHGKKSKSELQKFNRKMQMIFQDPYASLNPRMKVSDLIAEGIDIHRLTKSPKERINFFHTFFYRLFQVANKLFPYVPPSYEVAKRTYGKSLFAT